MPTQRSKLRLCEQIKWSEIQSKRRREGAPIKRAERKRLRVDQSVRRLGWDETLARKPGLATIRDHDSGFVVPFPFTSEDWPLLDSDTGERLTNENSEDARPMEHSQDQAIDESDSGLGSQHHFEHSDDDFVMLCSELESEHEVRENSIVCDRFWAVEFAID